MAKAKVTITGDSRDARRSIDKFDDSSKKLRKTVNKLGNIGMAALAAGIAAAGVAAFKATQKFADFEYQMAQVSTLITRDTQQRINDMSRDIQNLAIETGVATDDLTEGMYQVVSAFGEAADASAILRQATKAAAAGGSSVKEAIDLLSAVTKGYGDTSVEAQKKVADLAFQTVKLGQTTFPELAGAIGRVVPMASTLGIEVESVFGAMSTLTGVTGDTAEVSTQLSGVFRALVKPTKDMKSTIAELGYESGKALIESEGLQGALLTLTGAVGGNEEAIGKLFPEVRGLNAIFALTGKQAENMKEKTDAMTEATGESDDAFDKMQKTLKTTLDRMKRVVDVLLIRVGGELQPMLETFADWMVENMPLISTVIVEVTKVILAQLDLWGTAIWDTYRVVKSAIDIIIDIFELAATMIKLQLAVINYAVRYTVDTILDDFSRLEDLPWVGDKFKDLADSVKEGTDKAGANVVKLGKKALQLGMQIYTLSTEGIQAAKDLGNNFSANLTETNSAMIIMENRIKQAQMGMMDFQVTNDDTTDNVEENEDKKTEAVETNSKKRMGWIDSEIDSLQSFQDALEPMDSTIFDSVNLSLQNLEEQTIKLEASGINFDPSSNKKTFLGFNISDYKEKLKIIGQRFFTGLLDSSVLHYTGDTEHTFNLGATGITFNPTEPIEKTYLGFNVKDYLPEIEMKGKRFFTTLLDTSILNYTGDADHTFSLEATGLNFKPSEKENKFLGFDIKEVAGKIETQGKRFFSELLATTTLSYESKESPTLTLDTPELEIVNEKVSETVDVFERFGDSNKFNLIPEILAKMTGKVGNYTLSLDRLKQSDPFSLTYRNIRKVWTETETARHKLYFLKGAFKGFFKDVLSDTKTVTEAFGTLWDNVIQGVIDKLAELAAEKIFTFILDITTGGGGTAFSWIGELLGYAEGGVVPGPIGAPQPAIVHGGETITPPGQANSLTINVTGNKISSGYDVDRIGDQIVRKLRRAGVVTG